MNSVAPRPTEPSADVRLKLAPSDLQHRQAELLFQVSHHFLEEAHLLSHGMLLEPVSVLIVETVRVGSIERSLRPAACNSGRARHAMSRRAVAEATGLPRETVRRRVKRLVELGVLLDAPNGALSVAAADDVELGRNLQRHLANHVSMTNSLIDAGLIGLCTGKQQGFGG